MEIKMMKHKDASIHNKWFPSVPGAAATIPFWIFGIFFFIYMIIYAWRVEQRYTIPAFLVFLISSISLLIYMAHRAVCYIRLHENYLECFVLFRRRIILEYSKCTIGIDYSLSGGGKLYWIYLCYGMPPQYKSKDTRNRINALKCNDGFVRIVYRKDIYESLLRVLPKQQRIALESSRKVYIRKTGDSSLS